jgi:hypothetical protein
MYKELTFKWVSTLLGCIAVLMAPIPFVLLAWGPKIRAKSRFASALLETEEKVLGEGKERMEVLARKETGTLAGKNVAGVMIEGREEGGA